MSEEEPVRPAMRTTHTEGAFDIERIKCLQWRELLKASDVEPQAISMLHWPQYIEGLGTLLITALFSACLACLYRPASGLGGLPEPSLVGTVGMVHGQYLFFGVLGAFRLGCKVD